jgi:hypothetical protein
MANQVQCPNCGGYKVNEDVIGIDSKTGKSFPVLGYCGFVVLLMVIYVMVGALWLAVYGNKPTTSSCLMSTVFILLFFWGTYKFNKREKRAWNLYKYECKLCGYQWEWREGQPRPTVNVRPDLIEKGEQRLEQQRRKE